MGKKINELTSAVDLTVANDNQLLAIADPATGVASKMTVAQAKKFFGGQRLKYVATGAEGSSLVIAALAGMNITMITREGSVQYDTTGSPDTTEYTWDGTTIGLGLALSTAGERLIILYKA